MSLQAHVDDDGRCRSDIGETKSVFSDAANGGAKLPMDNSSVVADRRSFLRDDTYAYFEPDLEFDLTGYAGDSDGPRTGRRAFMEKTSSAQEQQRGVFVNPLNFFSLDVAGPEPIWDSLLRLAEGFESPEFVAHYKKVFPNKPITELARLTEYDDGNGSSMTVLFMVLTDSGDSASENAVEAHYAFSHPLASNLVYASVNRPDGSRSDMIYLRYQSVDGIVVPRLVSHSNGNGKYIVNRRKIEFTDCQLNHTQDPVLFSLKGLGLENGDRVVNRQKNETYVYRNGKLEEPSKFAPEVTNSQAVARLVNRSGYLWSFLAGIVAILVVGWLVSRLRKNAVRPT